LFVFRKGNCAMATERQGVQGRLWRIVVGVMAFGAATLGIVSSGYASSAPTDNSPGTTAVVECSSGTITQGDVQTSSLAVAKVPANAVPDLPGGCTVQAAS
jgi:hypothetical protein